MGELWQLSATEAVAKLRAADVSPLEMVEAAAARISAVEPYLNALPIRFLDDARARRKPSGASLPTIQAGSPACQLRSRTTTMPKAS